MFASLLRFIDHKFLLSQEWLYNSSIFCDVCDYKSDTGPS